MCVREAGSFSEEDGVEVGYVRYGVSIWYAVVITSRTLSPLHSPNLSQTNNNGYIELITRTGPKRLHL